MELIKKKKGINVDKIEKVISNLLIKRLPNYK